jgi:hypothetical protein
MMGDLQSMLAIALTVLRGCLSSLIEGAVRISKNTSRGINSFFAALFAKSLASPFFFLGRCSIIKP